MTILHLAGDLSSRKYYRLLNNQTLNSFILQIAEPFNDQDTSSHPFLSAQRLFKSLGVPVPEIVAMHGETGWILQVDLGDEMLQQNPCREHYAQALTHLMAINCNSLNHREGQVHFRQVFDREKFQFEMAHTERYLLKEYFQFSQADTFTHLTQTLTEYLSARPRFLAHRDYHSRNLMLQNDQVFVIDFQDARMGPLSYDMVSLVWDPYVSLSASFQEECVDAWIKMLRNKIQAADVSELAFLRDPLQVEELRHLEIPRMKVQRLLKACGSYASFFVIKGRQDFLHCIRPTLKEVGVTLTELVKTQWHSESDEKLLDFVSSLLDLDEPIIKE